MPIAWRSYRATDYPAEGQVGLISSLLAREFLRQPYWPHIAALELHQADQRDLPPHYVRAF